MSKYIKDCISLGLEGSFHVLSLSWFSSAGDLPFLYTSAPMKLIFSGNYWHFFIFHVSLYFLAIIKTHLVIINVICSVNANIKHQYVIMVGPLLGFGSIPRCLHSNVHNSRKSSIIGEKHNGKIPEDKSHYHPSVLHPKISVLVHIILTIVLWLNLLLLSWFSKRIYIRIDPKIT